MALSGWTFVVVGMMLSLGKGVSNQVLDKRRFLYRSAYFTLKAHLQVPKKKVN